MFVAAIRKKLGVNLKIYGVDRAVCLKGQARGG